MNTEYSYDRFDAYSGGWLSPEGKLEFEHALANDPKMRTAFDDYQTTRKVVDVLVYRDTKARVERAAKETAKIIQIKRKRTRLTRVAGIAAFVAGSLGYPNLQYTDDALVQRGLEDPQSFIARTETRSSADRVLSKAADVFEAEDYAGVLSTLKGQIFTGAAADNAGEMIGYSYIKLGNAQLAISKFEQLKENMNNELRRDGVEWELMLAYMQIGAIESVHTILDDIIADVNHDYHLEALQLKKKLNSIWRKLVF